MQVQSKDSDTNKKENFNNIKAIVFDLDDTLIPWRDEYVENIMTGMLKHNISKVDTYQIYKLVNTFEMTYTKLDKEELLNYLNKHLDIKLNMALLDEYIALISSSIFKEDGVKETLQYLSQKYDLYIVTNWFTSSQEKRLAKLDILKYFKKVYGADINYYKPYAKSFDVILDKYAPHECLAIGDALEKDILLPLALGMKAIWKTNEKSKKYKTIKNILDLKEIL